MSILAVGTVGLDSVETPSGSATGVLGGSVPFIVLAARYFCEPVRLVAVVGGDFPPQYLDVLRRSGVDLEGLEHNPEGRTFAWEGRYHENMNDRDTLATHLNVLATFSPVLPAHYRRSSIVCLGNLDPRVQLEILNQVERPDLTICDTMNFWIRETPETLRSVLGRVDCLIINESEARQLSGEHNLIRAATAVMRMGPQILVLKKGEHGALLFYGDRVFSAPAVPLAEIVDPTGAGDAFAGGFSGQLSREARLDFDAFKRAVVYGTVFASFCVESFGPDRLLHLSEADIEGRAQQVREVAALPEFERHYRPVL